MLEVLVLVGVFMYIIGDIKVPPSDDDNIIIIIIIIIIVIIIFTYLSSRTWGASCTSPAT